MLILGQKSYFLGPPSLKFHNRTDASIYTGVQKLGSKVARLLKVVVVENSFLLMMLTFQKSSYHEPCKKIREPH